MVALRAIWFCLARNRTSDARIFNKITAILGTFLPVESSIVSSANIVIPQDGKEDRKKGRSFINRIKKSGPNMLPCETPTETGRELDKAPLKHVFLRRPREVRSEPFECTR